MRDIQHALLLAIGILAAAKALWAMALPKSAARVLSTTSHVLERFPATFGVLLAALGLGAVAVVLLFQPLAHWMLMLVGIVWFAVGLTLVRSPDTASDWRRIVERHTVLWIRLWSFALLLFATLAILVALFNR